MYRDGSLFISACLVTLVVYAAILGFLLPDATVDFTAVDPEPEEQTTEIVDLDLGAIEGIGSDPGMNRLYIGYSEPIPKRCSRPL